MTNSSKAAQKARRNEAIKILGGTHGTIQIDGKQEKCRVTRAGMIVGNGRKNKHLTVHPDQLQPVSA